MAAAAPLAVPATCVAKVASNPDIRVAAAFFERDLPGLGRGMLDSGEAGQLY